MLYMSCTLCIYGSIENKQRFHRSLQSLSTHRLSIAALDYCIATYCWMVGDNYVNYNNNSIIDCNDSQSIAINDNQW